jgi:hypothetical protein
LRVSDDFFIEARKANPPEVRLTRPTGDYRASPIEEITVGVNADGEFGLNDLALHYSVNGGDEKVVSMLKAKGEKQASDSTTISLEDFKLVPGDIVSIYATAKDARSESRTDMFFIQADPFERQFSQSQQAGGGGGGGGGGSFGQGDQTEISQREKEIIAATWKQQGDQTKKPSKQEAAENAKFLAGVQAKLRDQALSLAGRLQRRELSDQNQEFSDFEKDMGAAAAAMAPATDKLQQQKWGDALPNEQKALQHLLRAEATFREIQVAFGARGGGGGGGAGGAGRDLSSLFDLELDTEKNQYETGQTASSGSQRAQEIDEALQKLEQLARRQQELAQQQRGATQTEQQRWQEEMLRREAEELQRQMEQMQRNQQGNQQGKQQAGQQGSGQQGSSSQSGSSGANGQQGANGTPSGSSSADNRMQQALDRLRQAKEDMARAASQNQNDAAARRAAERLQEASNLLGGMQQQEAGQQMDTMAREADRLQKEEQDQESRMKQVFARGNTDPSSQNEEQSKLADDRQGTAEALAKLEKQMQEAARGLGGTQPTSATKLREALSGMEQQDLQNRIRKSAEWVRRGIDPSVADAGEKLKSLNDSSIANGMQRLSDQLHQAQQAFNRQQQNPQEALNQVERLRNQMEALARGMNNAANRNGQQGQQGQPGQQGQQGQQGPLSRNGQPGQPGQQSGQQGGQAGQQGGQNAQGGGAPNGGPNGGPRGGAWAGGYGPLNNGQWYGGDTGGYWPQGRETQQIPSSPEEIQRAYQEAMRQLNALRQNFQGQPEPMADLQDLIRQMQRLDPSRFPGNPAMLEQLHDQVLTSVDKLELRLRRAADDKDAGQVRSGDSQPVPSGYQDSVADYFRRLSKNKND